MNRKYRSCKIKVNTAAMLVIKNKLSRADCVLFVLQIYLSLFSCNILCLCIIIIIKWAMVPYEPKGDQSTM